MGASQDQSQTPDDKDRPAGRILVLDRESNVRATIESLLVMAACDVMLASSAAAGLRLVRVWKPTLVLLDPNIRPGAPSDVVRAFWEAGQRRIPLVLLGGMELRTNGGFHGMISGSLAKPFDVRKLLAIVSRFVTCGS